MIPISVIMPSYNAQEYIREAIESVLNQSFTDFEFIIIDDGSTDNTVQIISSYKDSRIKLIQKEHDFINSLNWGIQLANGKYLARMDADDIMQVERLKTQYAIMEEDSQIIVCGSWMTIFGDGMPGGMISRSLSGYVEYPLINLLQRCILFHPTVMLRSDFLKLNNLRYEKGYVCAEDYKLWFEIAKCGGVFYIETQSLLYYRVSNTQVSIRKQKEQKEASTRIKKEILEYIISLNMEAYPCLSEIEGAMRKAQVLNLMKDDDICDFFYVLFSQNKNLWKYKTIIG